MKKIVYAIFLTLLLGGAYFLGAWSNERIGLTSSSGTHKVLYDVDPIQPAYRSDKPRIAPDCGMQPIATQEDGTLVRPGQAAKMLRACVRVSADKQQLIGVRVATVEKAGGAHTLRVLGRVVADETRLYRIRSATDGWIKHVLPVTTNGLVKKNELLATFYPPEFISAMSAYLYSLNSLDRAELNRKESNVPPATSVYIDSYRNALRNLGMTEYQLDEIMRTRKAPEYIQIRAPAAGMILARNLSPGQAFEKGTELYRIADLSRIWIVAETYENEARAFKGGELVRVTVPDLHKSHWARISDVPPSFDPTTRTRQVRLEADNPGYLLRPGMFADVELSVEFGPTIVVPIDAIVDSGSKKTVYVMRGEAVFEPREVETGWRIGDRVEILNGLMIGEKIVMSGTFLIDSESRMKSRTAELYGDSSEDPVCGIAVDQSEARAAGRIIEYERQTYYFSSDDCKERFANEPTKYTSMTLGAWHVDTDQPKGRNAKDKQSIQFGHTHSRVWSSGGSVHNH